MAIDNCMTLGEHFESDETKLEVLRATLAQGEAQLDRGEGIEGALFMQELIAEYG
ncbi:MAG: hypothetical protein MJK04_11470 [Psychrosphaera sp.]|nr:hypothetical protein [Psychrosphaera sp.]